MSRVRAVKNEDHGHGEAPESGRERRPDVLMVDPAEGLRGWMHEGLRDLARGGSILALSCDEAFLAPQLLDYASDVTVLDTSGEQMAQLAPRFPEISFLPHHPSDPLPFPPATFDAIWCCEYLDRVFDPLAALREINRVLVPGGRLVLSVASHRRVRHMIVSWFNGEAEAVPAAPRIRYFTKRLLTKVTREAGFRDIETATCGTVRKAGPRTMPRLLLKARKAAGLELARAGLAVRAGPVLALDEELAFAGRTRAA